MTTRVLIADDEKAQRSTLRDMLTDQGYLVVGEASNSISAVEQARQTRPDVVIMDIRMSKMDGLVAAKTITQEQIAPVVVLSASGELPLVEQAKEAGVMNYLVKPLRETQVASTLEVALAYSKKMRAVEKEVDRLKDKLITNPLIIRAKAVLMQTQSISEKEAYRKIQMTSMNTRKSMREVAEAILLANDIIIETEIEE